MTSDRKLFALPVFAAIALAAMPVGVAWAQTKPPVAPPQVSAEPQNTAAAYGYWIVRCQRVGEGAASQRICDIEQAMQVQGQQAPIAAIAIGRPGAKEPLHITAQLPTSISFPSTVKLYTDEKDAQPIELSWRRCLPAGCFADAEIKDDDLRRWKAQTGNGRLQFKDGAGRELALPFSFSGFPQAMDGLAKAAQ
jgi:invasion protein IalB